MLACVLVSTRTISMEIFLFWTLWKMEERIAQPEDYYHLQASLFENFVGKLHVLVEELSFCEMKILQLRNGGRQLDGEIFLLEHIQNGIFKRLDGILEVIDK